jgi:C4-dicarboxylate-specific signal transduction histidine kinase
VRGFAPSSGREIKLEVSGDTRGDWDGSRLQLVLATLLTESCDRDRTDRAIQMKADGSDPDVVRIEVTHHGTPSVDLQPHTPETGADNTEEECIRLGLGLFIARQIVLTHGGQIRLESNQTSGTRFTIELPRHS